ncbi:MAG: phophatidylserine decarboxylase associated domain-containing protein, partial [Acidobacteria bacterium]|nr:phophatidylserine decarboxylase associated domain-containing protein [Acidobacteriota bacterium]
MTHEDAASLDTQYRRLLPFRAGFLPRDRAAVDGFNRRLKAAAVEQTGGGQPWVVSSSVVALSELLESDGIVRMYVDKMIRQVPPAHKTVDDIPELLAQLDHITKTAPLYQEPDGTQNHFPMSSLFVYMMMTPAGEAAFRNVAFNDALRRILQQWC